MSPTPDPAEVTAILAAQNRMLDALAKAEGYRQVRDDAVMRLIGAGVTPGAIHRATHDTPGLSVSNIRAIMRTRHAPCVHDA
jgi:hypothetical protein